MEALAEKHGINLDMGEVKKVDEYLIAASSDDDGPQPIDVASRVVAHIAHRLPFVKFFTKRFEGRDKSSGLGSDLLALGAQIASRNEELIKEQGAEMVSNIISNKVSTSPNGNNGTHVEFGPSTPVDNNNGGN